MEQQTFVIDCPICNAKVAVIEKGVAINTGFDEVNMEPYGVKLVIGSCPRCETLLAGKSHQISFKDYGMDEDRWSDAVRIYPKPPKEFLSSRIPQSVRESLSEADRSMQANANIAACVMFGRALEAVCRDFLDPDPSAQTAETQSPPKKIMLGEGIRMLKDKEIIDNRLYDWSQQLRAFRNLAAHPREKKRFGDLVLETTSISREDAEDLQSFVYAIIENIYDLTDRYEEFKRRQAKPAKNMTWKKISLDTQ